jgi:hypothetical protein
MQAKEGPIDILSGQALSVPSSGEYLRREDTLRSLMEAGGYEGIRNPEALQGEKAILHSMEPKREESILGETKVTQESIAQKECILLLLLACVAIVFGVWQYKIF